MNVGERLLSVLVYAAFLQSSIVEAQQSESKALVTSLYKQVVARHPVGIPEGEDQEVFAPYLRISLRHQLNSYRACTADWLQ